MDQIIEVEQLSHHFGPVRAIDGLTYKVREGEVFGMLGPNGAGKTTNIRILNGLLKPTSGKVRVLGMDPIADGTKIRRKTGVLTETPSIYERLTGFDNLMIFGALYGIPEDKLAGQVHHILDQFGLSERAGDKTGGFSKGMKQRLALARAFVPLVFMVLMPVGIILIPTQIPAAAQAFSTQNTFQQIRQFVAPFLGSQLVGLSDLQMWVVVTTGYLLAPFLLMMPLMLSTIVGAESFVGEKERKTLEALIYTPTTDGELFLGKLLASVLPAIALAWLSFLIYGIAVNVASWPVMGRIWFPTITWLPIMLWLTPAIALLGMAVTVLISIKAKTFMEAYQMSGSLVVIVLGLLAGQVSGVLFLSLGISLVLGLVLFVIDGILIWFGMRQFARASLLSRI